MRVILAIDNGRADRGYFIHVRAAARTSFAALPDGAEVALMTTAPQPRYT